MSGTTLNFSIVIPCFDEAGAIAKTVHHLQDVLKDKDDYEIIVVDDGSKDGSSELLQDLGANISVLKLVSHEHNRGYGAALKTGIRRALGDIIVITDADGTYPNEMIPVLLEEMNGADMIVGARTGDSVTYPFIRRIPKAFLRRYCEWITGQRIPDMNSGLRAFKKSIADRLLHILPDSFSFTTTITLAMMTNSYIVRYIPINYSARIGKSKIQPIRDTLRISQLILRTGLYFAPIRTFTPVISILAILFVLCASYDVFVEQNLTDKTLVFLMLTVNSAFFVLLADIIDKRTSR
jgi:glycosyltransferase involved in cell wall biosynthesis